VIVGVLLLCRLFVCFVEAVRVIGRVPDWLRVTLCGAKVSVPVGLGDLVRSLVPVGSVLSLLVKRA
jgi:hypothetical protein